MDMEMKHEEMHKGPHMHEGHYHRPWQFSWKSPVSLGIFVLSVSISFAILAYTILSLVGVIIEAVHPAASQGLSQQELQQMMQSQGTGADSTGTTGQ
jgi:hypothetical protein